MWKIGNLIIRQIRGAGQRKVNDLGRGVLKIELRKRGAEKSNYRKNNIAIN